MLDDILAATQQKYLVQAMITTLVVGTLCFLWVTQKPVPDALLALVMVVIGFYFGTVSTVADIKSTNSRVNEVIRNSDNIVGR